MNKQIILVIIALIIIAVLVFVGYRNGSGPEQQGIEETAGQAAALGGISAENPLITQDVIVGTGADAVVGSTVTVHYVGTLTSGIKFDSSLDRGEPFTFTIGAGQVIPGWEQGLVGMKEGGTRTLLIAPELAYGSQAVGPIPANSALIFEIQLLTVQKTEEEKQ